MRSNLALLLTAPYCKYLVDNAVSELNPVAMPKMVIILFVILFCASGEAIAQNSITDEPKPAPDNRDNNSVMKIRQDSKNVSSLNKDYSALDNSDVLLHEYTNSVLRQKKTEVFHAPGIVSTFRSNINFGGFYQRYAIINFTPQMSIKPFDFINIYANHSSSIYIPISEVKSYFKSLAIKGAAVLAIENSLRYVLPPNQMVQSLTGFILKNLAISLLEKSLYKPDAVIEFKNYYYSVNIRF